jgi:methylenetetrahydrofolate reductase (NADPH)
MKKLIARFEALFKGVAFDCHACGQCVLSQTGIICPMSCPKGLRNGPCGGTVEGMCEVYPDKQCVWVRIHKRTAKDSLELPILLPTPDNSLMHTSSYINWLRGHDKYGRTPLAYMDLGAARTRQPPQTESLLEAKLKSGEFVRTCEIHSPRDGNLDGVRRLAKVLGPHFDAINASAFLNGKPSLPSPRVAAELKRLGIDAICQSTCRDHTKTTFVSEIIHNHSNSVENVLCLTGDSYAKLPKIQQVWDMDSALMIFEARYLRETGQVHFTGEKVKTWPRQFIGGAINPFTQPENVPIRRLKQKAAAGADFIQTQMIFDIGVFRSFMECVRDEGLDDDLFILAGVPVATSKTASQFIPDIPGVHCPQEILDRLARATDPQQEGLALAVELISELRQIKGVSGIHLMVLGPDHAVLPQLVENLPRSGFADNVKSNTNADLATSAGRRPQT